MTLADYFFLYLIVVIILEIVECVSSILLQLVHLSFSHIAILESPNVYISTIIPILPLSIDSHLLVYLS